MPDENGGIDEHEFLAVVREHPREMRRLQELGEEIPKSDGIGEQLAQAVEREDTAREAWLSTVDAVEIYQDAYNSRLSLMREERQILRSLHLHENLFRRHDPDPSRGES